MRATRWGLYAGVTGGACVERTRLGPRRFQKLYSDFKSERFGWRMVLLFRKLLLVSTTVMFNTLPLFQVGPLSSCTVESLCSAADSVHECVVCPWWSIRCAVRGVCVHHVLGVHPALVGHAVPAAGERAADLLRHRERRGLRCTQLFVGPALAQSLRLCDRATLANRVLSGGRRTMPRW